MRPMNSGDLDAVHAIESAVYSFPWSKRSLLDCLFAGFDCWVIEWDGEVFGYLLASFAADEGHLLNLCIHPRRQGEGWGRALLQRLLDLAHARRARRIFLEVRPGNHYAQRLYHKVGFRFLSRRSGYYRRLRGAGREDAWVYALQLQPESAP